MPKLTTDKSGTHPTVGDYQGMGSMGFIPLLGGGPYMVTDENAVDGVIVVDLNDGTIFRVDGETEFEPLDPGDVVHLTQE